MLRGWLLRGGAIPLAGGGRQRRTVVEEEQEREEVDEEREQPQEEEEVVLVEKENAEGRRQQRQPRELGKRKRGDESRGGNHNDREAVNDEEEEEEEKKEKEDDDCDDEDRRDDDDVDGSRRLRFFFTKRARGMPLRHSSPSTSKTIAKGAGAAQKAEKKAQLAVQRAPHAVEFLPIGRMGELGSSRGAPRRVGAGGAAAKGKRLRRHHRWSGVTQRGAHAELHLSVCRRLRPCPARFHFPEHANTLGGVSAVRPWISAVAFDRLGVLLAVASTSGVIHIFDFDEFVACRQRVDLEDGAVVSESVLHQERTVGPVVTLLAERSVSSLQWCPGSKDLIACTFTFTSEVHVFEADALDPRRPSFVLRAGDTNQGGHRCCAWLDDTRLIAGSDRGVLRLWKTTRSVARPEWAVCVSRSDPILLIQTIGSGSKHHGLIAVATRSGVLAILDTMHTTKKAFNAKPTPRCVSRARVPLSWEVAPAAFSDEIMNGAVRKNVPPMHTYLRARAIVAASLVNPETSSVHADQLAVILHTDTGYVLQSLFHTGQVVAHAYVGHAASVAAVVDRGELGVVVSHSNAAASAAATTTTPGRADDAVRVGAGGDVPLPPCCLYAPSRDTAPVSAAARGALVLSGRYAASSLCCVPLGVPSCAVRSPTVQSVTPTAAVAPAAQTTAAPVAVKATGGETSENARPAIHQHPLEQEQSPSSVEYCVPTDIRISAPVSTLCMHPSLPYAVAGALDNIIEVLCPD